MTPEDIAEIIEAYGPAKWTDGKLGDINGKGWFLLEATPLPPKEEICKVIYDIQKDSNVAVNNGQVRHYKDCKNGHSEANYYHPNIKRAIESLQAQSFILAVHPGAGIINNQPLAIPIEPVINYEIYPDHPHLNAGGFIEGKVFIPDTVCYAKNITADYEDQKERLIQAFGKIVIWLLRHMVWLETKKYQTNGIWIGLEWERLNTYNYPLFLNPDGLCRCGKKVQYKNCCLPYDLDSYKSIGPLSNDNIKKYNLSAKENLNSWKYTRQNPGRKFIASLKSQI